MVDATVNSTAALLDTAIPKDEPAGPNVRLPLHAKPAASLSPIGYFPDQIKHAYNFDQLPCTSLNTCGQGQTIAIIDAYDNSNVEKDLAIFSKEFGLPIMPNCESKKDVGCFQKLYVSGKKPLFDELWALEISLDVQWAHAIAPGGDSPSITTIRSIELSGAAFAARGPADSACSVMITRASASRVM